MDRDAAKIVAEKLDEISKRSAKDATNDAKEPSIEPNQQFWESDIGLSFDDIQPLDESDEP